MTKVTPCITQTWELEGAGEQTIETLHHQLENMCRQCIGKHTLLHHGCTDIAQEFPSSQDFWEIKHMRKQWISDSLVPRPPG